MFITAGLCSRLFLHVCVTYIISWQVGWCCILKSCVDHAQGCQWSSHSALITNSFLTCVRPTPLADRLANAVYTDHALPTLNAVTDHVTVLYFNCFLTFVRPTPLSAGRLADAACCIPKLCVAHAQRCHWSSHSALLKKFFTCVWPTSLAGRLDDAAYADHVLTMSNAVTDHVTVLC